MKDAGKANLRSVKVVGSVLVVSVVAMIGWVNATGPSLDPPAGPNAVSGRFGLGTEISSLPFTITSGGFYYLPHNLAGAEGGITVAAGEVTIDLNGFVLGGGTGKGIARATTGSITVRNGKVAGWEDNTAVDLSGGGVSVVENLVVSGNAGTGIIVGSRSIVRNCVVDTSGGGIIAGTGSLVTECVASGNSSHGFNVSTGSVVSNCVSVNNGGTGIVATDSLVIGSFFETQLQRGLQSPVIGRR